MRLPLLSAPGFLHDQEQFIIWGLVAEEFGLARVYDQVETPGGLKRLSNYPPVQILICRALAGVYPLIAGRPLDMEILGAISRRDMTPEARTAYVLFKWPAVAADIATGLLLYYFLRRRWSITFAGMIGLVYVLLPNVWHNSSVWGAVDALPALLVIVSMESALTRRVVSMWAFAVLAMLTKPQACIFLPIWLIASIRPGVPDPRQLILAASVALLIVAAAILPFQGNVGGVVEAYTGAPEFYPLTHLNGFSAWFLGRPMVESHLDGDLLAHYARDDHPMLFGLSARQLGVAGFLGVLGFACVVAWRRMADAASIQWAACVIPLAFFALSTQMHERYLYPAVALWAWSMAPPRRAWVCWFVLAVCAAINVFWVWPAPFEESLGPVLHRTWLGIPPGVWCAAGVLAVTIWTLIDGSRSEPRRPSDPQAPRDPSAIHG